MLKCAVYGVGQSALILNWKGLLIAKAAPQQLTDERVEFAERIVTY
jgi:hypothetical protein